VLVSAAASLTDAFAEIEAAFEAIHPGVDVVLNLGGSSSLRTQILEGAPVDVFASADASVMDQVLGASLVSGAPRVFARNRLQIAVPAGNPAGIRGLGDFADPRLRLGLCAETVPCGGFAREALERAGVVPALDTEEPDVRALLTKIELGELDAGITYRTDVASAQDAVEGIDLPPEADVTAEYTIACLRYAPNPDAADAFVRFVLSEDGRAILVGNGFILP
jgi:molybdate transport system substrate-binding protein